VEYKTRIGDRESQAHINYRCPCGCEAGLLYDRSEGPEHLGMCCCGRLLWVGPQAQAVLKTHYKADRQYEVEVGTVRLPWEEELPAALAVPLDALATEKLKLEAGKTPTKVVDPVCGMMFDPDNAAATTSYMGKTYYFCAESCKTKFDAEPRKYVPTTGLLGRLKRK
jgi:YHS domain-containing protein